jgi:drug/metabolite transporter (DMT)-like permease
MLFLGVVASLLCYWLWNIVLKELGAIRSTNYLYLNPVVAMITAYIVLDEQINHLTIIGTALILLGVYLLEKKKSGTEEDNETN